jgi:hypothetical protein
MRSGFGRVNSGATVARTSATSPAPPLARAGCRYEGTALCQASNAERPRSTQASLIANRRRRSYSMMFRLFQPVEKVLQQFRKEIDEQKRSSRAYNRSAGCSRAMTWFRLDGGGSRNCNARTAVRARYRPAPAPSRLSDLGGLTHGLAAGAVPGRVIVDIGRPAVALCLVSSAIPCQYRNRDHPDGGQSYEVSRRGYARARLQPGPL